MKINVVVMLLILISLTQLMSIAEHDEEVLTKQPRIMSGEEFFKKVEKDMMLNYNYKSYIAASIPAVDIQKRNTL